MKVIGLSGKAGSGKDYLTEKVLRPAGYFQISFADHLKVTTVARGVATYEEVYHTKPPHVRQFMQEEGTERWRKIYGENVWANAAFAWMQLLQERNGVTKFVIADVRFINEADFVRSIGGKVFRVDAPVRAAKSALTPEQRLHRSEIELDNYAFDAVIDNDRDDGVVQLQKLLIFSEAGITNLRDVSRVTT
jgi:hypothetical protein